MYCQETYIAVTKPKRGAYCSKLRVQEKKIILRNTECRSNALAGIIGLDGIPIAAVSVGCGHSISRDGPVWGRLGTRNIPRNQWTKELSYTAVVAGRSGKLSGMEVVPGGLRE